MQAKNRVPAEEPTKRKRVMRKKRKNEQVVQAEGRNGDWRTFGLCTPEENPEGLRALLRDFEKQYEPVGVVEKQLVCRIAVDEWRLARGYRIEGCVLTHELYDLIRRLPQILRSRYERAKDRDVECAVPSASQLREIGRADGLSESISKEVPSIKAIRGYAFIEDAEGPNAVSKASRYITSIQRSRDAATHELERVQAERKARERNSKAE